jgi:hypothetical protein
VPRGAVHASGKLGSPMTPSLAREPPMHAVAWLAMACLAVSSPGAGRWMTPLQSGKPPAGASRLLIAVPQAQRLQQSATKTTAPGRPAPRSRRATPSPCAHQSPLVLSPPAGPRKRNGSARGAPEAGRRDVHAPPGRPRQAGS